MELPSDLQRFNRAMGREGSGVSSADTEDDSHTMEDDEDEGKSKGGGSKAGGGAEGEKQVVLSYLCIKMQQNCTM